MTDTKLRLFAVVLGGTAPRANTELHDVVFAIGPNIESTYNQLLELWFGSPDGLHIDSWIELKVIDGYRVRLSEEPSAEPKKLFFVNMGAYIPGDLGEVHANVLLVGEEKKAIIKRAKERCLHGAEFVHRDYLYDVDECLEVTKVGRYYVHLEPTTELAEFKPVSAYHLIPRELVSAFKARQV